jgi:hypothetical protein
MPEFLKSALLTPNLDPLDLALRLVAAFLFGLLVAWIYRASRKPTEVIASFPATLVLLSILIAMVTQVIGDNVARAFSLVGALSIVRFRTVVRDTQDTAYVIFAVAVGMAVGAGNLWVAVIGTAVVGFAACMITRRAAKSLIIEPAYVLNLRVGLGHDADQIMAAVTGKLLQASDLVSIATARQGTALDMVYETRLRPGVSPNVLVKTLNTTEGVQGVELSRRALDRD